MVDTKDILLGFVGLILTAYGGFEKDIIPTIIGMILLFLTIQLNLQEQEEDIKILKAQINTQNELKKIREEMEKIKNEMQKRKK